MKTPSVSCPNIYEFNFLAAVFAVAISVTERLAEWVLCVYYGTSTTQGIPFAFSSLRFALLFVILYYYKIEETCNECRLRNTNESKFKFIFSFHRRRRRCRPPPMYWCAFLSHLYLSRYGRLLSKGETEWHIARSSRTCVLCIVCEWVFLSLCRYSYSYCCNTRPKDANTRALTHTADAQNGKWING